MQSEPKSKNEALDIYAFGSNLEQDAFLAALKDTTASAQVAVVEKLNYCWRCLGKVDDKRIMVDSAVHLERLINETGKCKIGKDGEDLTIQAVDDKNCIVTFTTSVGDGIGGKDLIVESLGGMAFRGKKKVELPQFCGQSVKPRIS